MSALDPIPYNWRPTSDWFNDLLEVVRNTTDVGTYDLLYTSLLATNASVAAIGTWSTWTPTFTFLNKGTTGTVVAKYVQIGKLVRGVCEVTLGGTGISVGGAGAVSFTLPVTSARAGGRIGSSTYLDSGVAFYDGSVLLGSTTVANFLIHVASGTYTTASNVSATTPFTWAAADTFYCEFAYEAA